MDSVLKPLKLSPGFPSYAPVFFGGLLKDTGRNYEKGYACVSTKYPRQTDIVSINIGEKQVCKSLAPLSPPDIRDITLTFKERCIAEAKLINPILGENTDFFSVEGDPIMFMEKEGGDYRLRQTNVMNQVLDFYSRLLRKNLKALTKTDNQAARQAIIGMSYELREVSDLSKRVVLEERLQDAFTTLTMQIAGEVN